MSTITLWLLISLGVNPNGPVIIERFTSQQECERLNSTLLSLDKYQPARRCVETKVYRP